MGLDLNRIPDKIVVELHQIDDVVSHESQIGKLVDQLIRKAYTEGLTMGLAAAHDTVIYQAVTDYILQSERSEHGNY